LDLPELEPEEVVLFQQCLLLTTIVAGLNSLRAGLCSFAGSFWSVGVDVLDDEMAVLIDFSLRSNQFFLKFVDMLVEDLCFGIEEGLVALEGVDLILHLLCLYDPLVFKLLHLFLEVFALLQVVLLHCHASVLLLLSYLAAYLCQLPQFFLLLPEVQNMFL
jgi:hypothetical protein